MSHGHFVQYMSRIRKLRRPPAGRTILRPLVGRHAARRFDGTYDELADELDPWLDLSVAGHPVLRYRWEVWWGNQNVTCAGVFTSTTKMVCPSFSLPAGPVDEGGTCQASRRRDLADDSASYICWNCYAISNDYPKPSIQLGQAVHRRWVRQALARGTFFEELQAAFICRLAKPGETQARKRSYLPTDLGFFRLHDCGDAAWAGAGYFLTWLDLAEAFPDVHFWQPTRDWTSAGFRQLVVSQGLPSNFTLRPSSLHFGAPAPVIEGFAAGTVSDGPADVTCPAYGGDTPGHTCEESMNPVTRTRPCRLCWTHPEVSVNYPSHGHEGPYFQNKERQQNPGSWEEWQAEVARLKAEGLTGDEVAELFEASAEWA